MKEHGLSRRKEKKKNFRKIESVVQGWRWGVTMLKSGQVGRQPALRVLFATLRSVNSILRAAEFQTHPMPQPRQAPHGSAATPGTFSTFFLFVLFLQFQMPAPPGKILFIVLSCVLDSSVSLLLYLAWMHIMPSTPIKKCCVNKPRHLAVPSTLVIVFKDVICPISQGSSFCVLQENVSQPRRAEVSEIRCMFIISMLWFSFLIFSISWFPRLLLYGLLVILRSIWNHTSWNTND